MKGFNKTTPPRSPLCFTANTANSSIGLCNEGSPTSVTIETSTDGINWNTYTINTAITLSNIGDKVYFRNTSTTDTGFSTVNARYYFDMSGSIAANGDITSLLNKNGTKTVGERCFRELFKQCGSLTEAPSLPATTLGLYCYSNMFRYCSNLTTLPKLPATVLPEGCYSYMFSNCANIKLSTIQTGEYQTAYRIPITGTGTDGGSATNRMFYTTGGTFTGTPSINTTYYTSNTLV